MSLTPEYRPDKYVYSWIWDKKVLEKEFYAMRDRIQELEAVIAKSKESLGYALLAHANDGWSLEMGIGRTLRILNGESE